VPHIPVGFGQVSYVFAGGPAGPGGAMVTLGLDVPPDVAPAEMAEDLWDAFSTNIMPGLSSSLLFTEARLRFAVTTGEIVQSFFGETVGGDTSESSPPNVAWPVIKFSAFGGRANRGRWFLPGIPEDIVDPSGAINGDATDALNTQLGAFIADLAAANFVPVVLHSDPELAPTVILAMLSGNKVYTRGSRVR